MMGGQDIAQQRGENALKPRNTFLLLVLNNSVTLVMSHKFLQAQTSQKGTKMPSSKEQHVCVCVSVCLCVCVCVCLWVWPVCFPIKGKAYCRVGELHVESIYILNSCIVPADNPKPTVPAN